ncbi:MAG: alpha/beta hydrolase [Microbacteriaceae bacterium]|nr:alpha/beta hydrolase [Microbacteriaceae bacterium]
MSEPLFRPPYDPELQVVLATPSPVPITITPDLIPALRAATQALTAKDVIGDRQLHHSERVIPGPAGAPDLIISIFKRHDHSGHGPGIYYVHGGGMIISNRFHSLGTVLDWVLATDAVAVSVEYRLAPEDPDPAPVEDAYAGLVWTAEHAAELGIDPNRIIVSGISAGGGLAAGIALLARDRKGPAIIGQLLMCPMLDERNDTVSSRQFVGIGVWDGPSNDTGWDALLGDRRHTDQVSIYASPSRATDLSNLPPAYIDVGSAEVFRDEDVAYASALWASGTQAELHVWPGGFHGFENRAPHAHVSRRALDARLAWLKRVLETS